MNNSKDTASQEATDIEELQRRVDAGYVPNDGEHAALVRHGGCPTCARSPEAEPGMVECEESGFHQAADQERSNDRGSENLGPERDYLSLPGILKRYSFYVGWNREERETASGIKITKVPYNIATGAHASSTDSLTWAPFDQALAAYLDGKYDGIGPVISTGDPYTFIDCDNAIDPDERERALKEGGTDPFAGLKPWARFVRSIAPRSYVGLSQSGRGLHIIMRGKLPGPGGKRPVVWDGVEVGKIEMYDRERFVALTGVTL